MVVSSPDSPEVCHLFHFIHLFYYFVTFFIYSFVFCSISILYFCCSALIQCFVPCVRVQAQSYRKVASAVVQRLEEVTPD